MKTWQKKLRSQRQDSRVLSIDINFSNPLEVLHRHECAKKALGAGSTSEPTNAQLAIIAHRFLDFYRLRPDKAPLARFIHLLSTRKYSNITNSGIYEKLRKLPAAELSSSDLQCIQQLCGAYELHELAEFIASSVATH